MESLLCKYIISVFFYVSKFFVLLYGKLLIFKIDKVLENELIIERWDNL